MSIESIASVEFIGESLSTINNNFSDLDTRLTTQNSSLTSLNTIIGAVSAYSPAYATPTLTVVTKNGVSPTGQTTINKASFPTVYTPSNTLKYPINVYIQGKAKSSISADTITITQSGTTVYSAALVANTYYNWHISNLGTEPWVVSTSVGLDTNFTSFTVVVVYEKYN